MVTSRGYDGRAFIHAVIAAGLGRLSASVGRLLAAAAYWSKHGVLPDGSVQAMRFEMDQFLTEPNGSVMSPIATDHARRIAERLAAFLTFSGTQSLALAAAADDAALSVDRLPSAPEPTAPERPIVPDDYRQVLRTSLFDRGLPGTWSFGIRSTWST